jgi:plasmid stabilization system protein ParE
LDEHCGHIAADNPEAAEHVRQIILNPADFLAQHRELGPRIRKACRGTRKSDGSSCRSSATT